MKLTINPMPALIAAKKEKVNEAFAKTASMDIHRELAHAQKLQWATSDKKRLKAEADLRGITTDELASMILAKSGTDTLADRELHRQQIMKRIEAAKTPDDLDAI